MPSVRVDVMKAKRLIRSACNPSLPPPFPSHRHSSRQSHVVPRSRAATCWRNGFPQQMAPLIADAARRGGAVAYMAGIEAAVYIIAIGWETTSPFTVYLTNGRVVPWLRYLEWLITCPGACLRLAPPRRAPYALTSTTFTRRAPAPDTSHGRWRARSDLDCSISCRTDRWRLQPQVRAVPSHVCAGGARQCVVWALRLGSTRNTPTKGGRLTRRTMESLAG
jgi:hypothetical protein